MSCRFFAARLQAQLHTQFPHEVSICSKLWTMAQREGSKTRSFWERAKSTRRAETSCPFRFQESFQQIKPKKSVSHLSVVVVPVVVPVVVVPVVVVPVVVVPVVVVPVVVVPACTNRRQALAVRGLQISLRGKLRFSSRPCLVESCRAARYAEVFRNPCPQQTLQLRDGEKTTK